MNIAYLALGSNLCHPQRQLIQAIATLRTAHKINVLATAPIYHNPAIGRKVQPCFYNTVLKITTTLTPQQLLQYCQRIELRHKRVKKHHWGARTLDIDILLYNQLKINTLKLIIPHPHYKTRDFVQVPLQYLYN